MVFRRVLHKIMVFHSVVFTLRVQRTHFYKEIYFLDRGNPNLKGEVVHVSPDAIEDPGGSPFYKVRIATEKDFFERHGVIYSLVPGVQVTCSIRTGQRSVLAYLTDPFLGSFQTALRER